jgi:hypothetical protein
MVSLTAPAQCRYMDLSCSNFQSQRRIILRPTGERWTRASDVCGSTALLERPQGVLPPECP